jgi:hypothetical protein
MLAETTKVADVAQAKVTTESQNQVENSESMKLL